VSEKVTDAIYESADYNESNEVDDESRDISRKIYALSVATDNNKWINTQQEFFDFARAVEKYLRESESKPLTG
jgi:hypothetical protein